MVTKHYTKHYFYSKPKTVMNHNHQISHELQITKQDILNKIAQWISEGSDWTIESATITTLIQSNKRIKLLKATHRT